MNTNPQTLIRDDASSVTHLPEHAICIIGMHRSGTSMIAQLLHQFGLYLGPDNQLLGATSANTDGHFEHKGFLKINRALLEHFQGSWESPPRSEAGWETDTALEPLRADARVLIAELSARSLWGWKEPRTTVLLPFWKSLVPGLRFVICVRSPLEVAKSLAKRNDIPVEQGMFLWQRYTRAALEDSKGSPRLIVHYEDFFIDPDKTIERLARFSGLEKPANISLGESGVRPELRHQRSGLAEILSLQSVPAENKFLYLGLRGLAREEREGDLAEAVGELLKLLDDLHNHDRLARLEAELAEARNEAFKLRADMLKDLRANHRWAYRMYRNFIKPFRVR
jgi:hypothetical protein